MKRIIYILIIAATLVTGCGKWLDVRPFDQISEQELLKNEEGYQKLLNGIYIELCREELYGASLSAEMIEVMGGAYEIGDDNIVWGNYTELKRYDYESEYWRMRFGATWNKAYAMILNCNKLLENMVGKESMFTSVNYNIIKGEALALRAMLHFDMLRIFGPVYKLDPDAKSIPYYTARVSNPEPQQPASKIIELILKDLNESIELLKVDPIIKNGTMMSSNGGGQSDFLRYRALRLNYYAVRGLLARVNLYAGNNDEAFNNALEVIGAVDEGIFSFVEGKDIIGSVKDPDRIFSSEILFAHSSTQRVKIFKNYFDPNRTSFTFKMEHKLLTTKIYGGASLTGGYQDDFRNVANWNASGLNRYFYKYADMTEPGKIQNTMIPAIRLGEMYLIAAETQSDDLSFGLPYVNMLREHRGGLTPLSTLTPELLQYEYIREMYGEGQLFFMYKRMYSDIIRSADAKYNVHASRNVFTVPLPEDEIEVKPEQK